MEEKATKSKAERSKIGKRSKRKGSKFQRKVGKLISTWWTGSPDNFRSTPGSGGWDKEMAPGDIIPKKGFEEFPFTIECKKRRAIDIITFLNAEDDFWDWWTQTTGDGIKSGKIPLLIMSQDFGHALIAYNPEELAFIGLDLIKVPRLVISRQSNFIVTSIAISKLDDLLQANQGVRESEGYRERYLRERPAPPVA